jgi:hypothetical protein
LEAGEVVDGMRRTKTEGKPFWPTFRICMAKEAAQKMRVDAAAGGKVKSRERFGTVQLR